MNTLNPVVDGFTYNLYTRRLPYRFIAHALAQMDVLRRANNYRCRMYVFPDDLNSPVAAYDTVEEQIRVTPNTYLWGVTLLSFDSREFIPQNGSSVVVKITESCTGVPLSSDYVTGNCYQPLKLRNSTTLGVGPMLLPQPRLIGEPGLINIEVSNVMTSAQYFQLILHCAEPCETIFEN